jgi:hypothetical protein
MTGRAMGLAISAIIDMTPKTVDLLVRANEALMIRPICSASQIPIAIENVRYMRRYTSQV